jgi:hypothetical protein
VLLVTLFYDRSLLITKNEVELWVRYLGGGLLLLLSTLLFVVSRSRIIVNEHGIDAKQLFRKRSVAWYEVACVRARDGDIDVETADHKHVRISSLMRVDGRPIEQDFLIHLQRYAPKARMEGIGPAIPVITNLKGLRNPYLPPFVYQNYRKWRRLALVPVIAWVALYIGVLLLRNVSTRFMVLEGSLKPLGMYATGIVVLNAVVFGMIFQWRLRRTLPRLHAGMCWMCGYDLRGMGDGKIGCPECGTEVERKALQEKWTPLKNLIGKEQDGRNMP